MYQRKTILNQLKAEFYALSENESLARSLVCAFAAQCTPSVAELADVRCAVSEAVTNAIVHGYDNRENEYVDLDIEITAEKIIIDIIDNGKGIEDIEKAKEPLYSSKADEERSGLGFTIMELFSDKLEIESKVNQGTKLHIEKNW